MQTVKISTLLLIAGATVSAEVFFNVPIGLDRNAVKAAFLEHGIKGFDPAARPNSSGLITANGSPRPAHEDYDKEDEKPEGQKLSNEGSSAGSQGSSQGKPVAVPLTPAHGSKDNFQPAAKDAVKSNPVPQASVIVNNAPAHGHGILTSTLVVFSTATHSQQSITTPASIASTKGAIVERSPFAEKARAMTALDSMSPAASVSPTVGVASAATPNSMVADSNIQVPDAAGGSADAAVVGGPASTNNAKSPETNPNMSDSEDELIEEVVEEFSNAAAVAPAAANTIAPTAASPAAPAPTPPAAPVVAPTIAPAAIPIGAPAAAPVTVANTVALAAPVFVANTVAPAAVVPVVPVAPAAVAPAAVAPLLASAPVAPLLASAPVAPLLASAPVAPVGAVSSSFVSPIAPIMAAPIILADPVAPVMAGPIIHVNQVAPVATAPIPHLAPVVPVVPTVAATIMHAAPVIPVMAGATNAAAITAVPTASSDSKAAHVTGVATSVSKASLVTVVASPLAISVTLPATKIASITAANTAATTAAAADPLVANVESAANVVADAGLLMQIKASSAHTTATAAAGAAAAVAPAAAPGIINGTDMALVPSHSATVGSTSVSHAATAIAAPLIGSAKSIELADIVESTEASALQETQVSVESFLAFITVMAKPTATIGLSNSLTSGNGSIIPTTLATDEQSEAELAVPKSEITKLSGGGVKLKPLMFANLASATVFKPDDLDKFTFPAVNPLVNMNGMTANINEKHPVSVSGGARVDSGSSNIAGSISSANAPHSGFQGSMPGGKPSEPHSTEKAAVKSISSKTQAAPTEVQKPGSARDGSGAPKSKSLSIVEDDKDSSAAGALVQPGFVVGLAAVAVAAVAGGSLF
ncbi:hypothetical protein LPJ66_000450 [Kickxella alabastrina]|uniref:Uncharacterized protein n=1 Tax=Kickxella alabastrina TaxID=61397 RepID=A0ACC1IVZ6_9FUNG|nr:hypothetical protein LPJ66_000450 [Kickxella alabastrina]